MPAEGVHLTALREAAALAAPPLRRALVRWDDAGRLGAVLLDLAYFDRYAEEVARYALRLPPRASRWGDAIHTQRAVEILLALLGEARRSRSARVAAIALGVASHVAIDRQLHPLINALARAHGERADPGAAHREVEKFQSILFHERYFGEDRMGSPGIVRLVQVPARELVADDEVGPALVAAFGALAADGRPPTQADLAGLARGYEQHATLLGTPLGKTLARPADKARAVPRYLEGSWGRFEALLEAAVTRSVEALERAWACFEAASPPERERADAALLALLPPGTIDPDGAEVDLAAPFTPAL